MSAIETPIFHLEKVVKARDEEMEDFNGPLDLILHLLSKNKMEIKDIQISLILDQYLAWMARRKELDLEVASEFVAMAAQLVFIKLLMLELRWGLFWGNQTHIGRRRREVPCSLGPRSVRLFGKGLR